ncbi:MAG: beta-ketoacyl synthase N-terminal-like domain-containing protein [Steroidobacteraceae bacterium]
MNAENTWQIYATGDHYHDVVDTPADLKALTQATTGKSFRRIGRFIQLALIGASRCAGQTTLPANTGVYMASGRGDLELTLDIMTQLFRDAQAPKPLSFVNTVSNAACFYLAQHLGLQSRSNFVCNRYSAFESVLQLAVQDLSLGIVSSALVGSVDIATSPLHEHRLRSKLAPETALGEGSHWLWLGPVDQQRPRVGELLAVAHCSDREALLSWINQQNAVDKRCHLAAGQFIPADEFANIQSACSLNVLTDAAPRGYYDSHSGGTLNTFLSSATLGDALLHINSDGAQRYSAMLIRR